MRRKVWTALFVLGLGMGMANGQTPAAGSPQQAPAGSMSGMEMGQGKKMGMDMGPCKCPCMSGTEMGKGKAMGMGGMDMGKGMGGMEMNKPAVRGGTLTITYGGKSAAWTPAALGALPHQTEAVWNAHTMTCATYSGVPLIELLKPLGVPDKPHGKDFRLYLVAEGADGYQVVYSVAEVTPDVHDGMVLVADAMDGKPLGDDGALKLVATGEKRPARWVHGVVAIRVLAAQ